ncbi:agamous-like MADS-box protein AGL62 [Canna indica]|uniref:Agamous-like MADS-box protein AGL62 n=1 Tax=Canna indica TaxID=4628 RepID=A0AAQ3Q6M4_9LILI|nr:agamous-like MADS-box protein AGL62 [Canna indica]
MSSSSTKKVTRGKQKRRNDVFTKASDLATLCGTDVLVLIFSPTGRPHSFGSPTADLLADRILAGARPTERSSAERGY